MVELNLDYATKRDDGSFYIESDDGKLEFDVQVFANKWGIGAENVLLTVLKPGYTPGSISDSAQMTEAIAFTDLKDVFKDRVYFKVMMPEDSQQGIYTAVMSAQVNGNPIEETLQFEYVPNLKSKYVRSVSVKGDYADGMVEVSNNDYTLDCIVSMNTLFPANKDYTITVSSLATDEIVYRDVVTHSDKNIDTVKINLPKDAIEGIYKVTVECGGDVAKPEALFNLKKPTENIILSDIVRTGGEKLTLENIASASSFDVVAKNVTDAKIDAFVFAAAYNADGVMIGSAAKEAGFEPGVETPVNVEMSMSGTINTVKIYVWDKTSATPHIEVYSIK